jgi:release factor glutamine methyltransferase
MPVKPAGLHDEPVCAVGTTLAGLVPRLEPVSETPGLDAQVLLARVLEKPRSWVLAHPEAPLTRTRVAALESLVRRLERGNPLPYVLGHWEFFGLDFEVTPDVLIPRPETELLVERAIAWLRANPSRRRAVDVGTGSGCIAVSLAADVPDLRVMATDISPAALAVASRNAEKNRVAGRVEFCCCDLFPDRVGFDLILANLPYIPTETLKQLPVCGREPALALDGGPDGLAVIRRLLEQVPDRLVPGGLLLMEIEASQGSQALSTAYDAFSEAEIHLHRDLADRDRLLEIQV